MDTLAAELEKVAIPVTEPEVDSQSDPNDTTGNEEQSEDETTETEDGEQQSTEETQDNGEEGNPFQPILAKLGVTESVNITNLEDLDKVIDTVVAAQQERFGVYDRPDIKAVVDFMAAGGSIAEYNAKPQPIDRYQKLEFADDDDAKAEEFLKEYYTEQGLKPIAIKATIDALKGEGELLNEAKELVGILATKEKEYNDNLAATEQAEFEQRQSEIKTFFKELGETFDKPLNGVSASKELVAEAKAKSLPNKEGVIEVLELTNNFTPQQHALLNLAVLAIHGKKEFKYTPVAQAAKSKGNPIDAILKGTKSTSSAQGNISELEQLVSRSKQ